MWWKCPEDTGHEWEAGVNSRSRGAGCPYCSGLRTTPTASLSALRPDLAAQWHPTKNDPLTPEDLTPGSGKKVWWKCPEDTDHDWEAGVNSRQGVTSSYGSSITLADLSLDAVAAFKGSVQAGDGVGHRAGPWLGGLLAARSGE